MKKIILILVFVFLGGYTFAQQWSGTTDIYKTVNGKVGIGTTAPAYILHINEPSTSLGATFYLEGNRNQDNKTVTAMQMKSTATGDQFLQVLRKYSGGSEFLNSVYRSASSKWLEFIYVNINTQKYEMRNGIIDAEFKNSGNILLNNTGNVGIGMGTTPIPDGAKLAIGGKVVCKEVEVTLTGLPDFVFNDNYKLRPLYEVESFIKENKHLPDVPCEAEVLEKGLNVGEMNATLLQKVEELTLYMINLQKENDALKTRVDQLEKK